MPIGKGQRIIVLHCGGKDGFVEGCDLVFKSTHIDGRDYHSEMNAVIFTQMDKQSNPCRTLLQPAPHRT